MNAYETMFIVNPLLSEEDTAAVAERIKTIINDGGKITKEDDWGVKELAYEMNKQKTGHFFVINFEGTNAVLEELNHVFKIAENIFRGIVVKTKNE